MPTKLSPSFFKNETFLSRNVWMVSATAAMMYKTPDESQNKT